MLHYSSPSCIIFLSGKPFYLFLFYRFRCVPGLAFKNQLPYINLKISDLLPLTSTQIQAQFFRVINHFITNYIYFKLECHLVQNKLTKNGTDCLKCFYRKQGLRYTFIIGNKKLQTFIGNHFLNCNEHLYLLQMLLIADGCLHGMQSGRNRTWLLQHSSSKQTTLS